MMDFHVSQTNVIENASPAERNDAGAIDAVVLDAASNESFWKHLIQGLLPHELLWSCFLFAFRPHRFIAELRNDQWRGKSHPAAFLLASLALVTFIDPWLSNHFASPQWYSSYQQLDETSQRRFLELFGLDWRVHQDLVSEIVFVNSTPASEAIRDQVGSLVIDDITIFIASRDAELAKSFSAGVGQVDKFQRYSVFLMAPILAAAWSCGGLICYGLFKQESIRFRHPFYLIIYWQGIWLILGHVVVGAGILFIPDLSSRLSAWFGLFELSLFGFMFVHGCWLLGLLVHRSIWLRLVAMIASYGFALLIAGFLIAILAIASDWLP